ncbi:MAG: hypothetical protein NTW61_02535 [Candidatus Melainabacteria bacterium]|nr:hypothetical protein [Candidatus Melainabacteria bacterium]
MMMSPVSSSPTQSTKNNRSASSSEVNGKKTKATSQSKAGKKRYTPKKYPKLTLAELALLVGNTQKIPPPDVAPEKPLPYELKWRENGAELCLFSANQGFIAAQMVRLQTHVVQPMHAPMLFSVSVEEDAEQLVVVEAEQEMPTQEAVKPVEEVITALQERIKLETPATHRGEETSTTTHLLSALLGIQEADNTPEDSLLQSDSEEEDPCPTSIELEFETPIEAQIADYLGVKHSSKTTISVTEKPTQQASKSIQPDTALLPIEDYFSEALETELAQQKAWLESALEREKHKAYPNSHSSKTATLLATEEESETMIAETEDPLFSAESEIESSLIGSEEALKNNEASETEAEANEKDFAAVLGSLMEDFSTEEAETPTQALEAEATTEPEKIDGFEIVGLFTDTPEAETDPEVEENLAIEEPAQEEPAEEAVVTLPAITPPNNNNPFAEITSFTQLLKVTRPETPMDFLLLGAYFLKQQEQKEAFSLRQLNHLLSSASKPNANHTVLELALAKHFITMVPDLTGTAKSTEYQLSKAGDATALRLFKTTPTT